MCVCLEKNRIVLFLFTYSFAFYRVVYYPLFFFKCITIVYKLNVHNSVLLIRIICSNF